MAPRILLAFPVIAAFILGSVIAPRHHLPSTPTSSHAPCESDGVAVAFETAFSNAGSSGYRVESVRVSDIDPACSGGTLVVALSAGSTVLAEGSVSSIDGPTAVVAVAPPAHARDVTDAHIEIATGGSPTRPAPGVSVSPTPSTDPEPELDIVQRGLCRGLVKGSIHVRADGVPVGWTLVGTDGADTLTGEEGDDAMCGLRGEDSLHGGRGDDRASGGPRSDDVTGGPGRDVLNGRFGPDDLRGGRGNDRARGARGDDTMRGHTGTDLLWGGRDDDHLSGGIGRDLLRGGVGHDVLIGAGGADILNGGDGFDVCIADRADITYNCERVIPRSSSRRR